MHINELGWNSGDVFSGHREPNVRIELECKTQAHSIHFDWFSD